MDSKDENNKETFSERVRERKDDVSSLSSAKSLSLKRGETFPDESMESLVHSDTSFEDARMSLLSMKFKADIKKSKKTRDYVFKVRVMFVYIVLALIFIAYLVRLVLTIDLGFVTIEERNYKYIG